MKTKLEDIIGLKCRACGSEGKWDIYMAGHYYNPKTGEDKDKATVNCRHCKARLL